MASSKKKAAATRMTLKDFHGGSIPSDLPLPSAPGVSFRPPDRPAPARRLPVVAPPPAPAPAPPLLSLSTARIGRNFDDDERAPFEIAGPPRHSPVEVLPPPPIQPLPVRSAVPNAWVTRKETLAPPPAALPTVGSSACGRWSASRVASASAVEKVISGQWHSKVSTVQSTVDDINIGVRGLGESDRRVVVEREQPKLPNGRESEHLLSMAAESVKGRYQQHFDADREKVRPLSAESEWKLFPAVAETGGDRWRLGSGLSEWEHPRSGMDMYARRPQSDGHLKKEPLRFSGELDRERERPRSVGYSAVGMGTTYGGMRNAGRLNLPMAAECRGMLARPASHEGRVVADVSERPRLKLLPRTRPTETQVLHVCDPEVKQGHPNGSKVVLTDEDGENRAVDWQRMNLSFKPHASQAAQSDEKYETKRQTPFGDARPRELVLKERGVDIFSDDIGRVSPTNRAKKEVPRTDGKIVSASSGLSNDKVDTAKPGQKILGDTDRRDPRWDAEKVNIRKPGRWDDSWGVTRNTEKVVEHARPELNTWRKPVEQPRAEVQGPRFGKTASPLEIARAFAKSSSGCSTRSSTENAIASQRVAPGQHYFGPLSQHIDGKRMASASAALWRINGY